MTTTRNIGRALGVRCSGRTDSGPCPVCGDPGFMAQDRAGRTLVTGHAGGNPNHARAALPKQGLWGSTAEPDRASPAPSSLSDLTEKRVQMETLFRNQNETCNYMPFI
jgi:hypothetical protein